MKTLLAFSLLIIATPALADGRDFCAERPGQTTPPCTLDPGRVMLEMAAISWTTTSDPARRTDTVIFGDSVVRVGLTPRLEAQLGWTPIGHIRSRDRATGTVTSVVQTGDVKVGFLFGLAGANGPVALQGFVSLPTGGDQLGAGDWGAGARLPIALPLGKGVSFAVTPEVDAAVNGSGQGRHVSYGGAAGLGLAVTTTLQLSTDVAVFRNEDPSAAVTNATSGLSLGWQAGKNTQFDIGGTAGLNRNSPDLQLYLGIAHRF